MDTFLYTLRNFFETIVWAVFPQKKYNRAVRESDMLYWVTAPATLTSAGIIEGDRLLVNVETMKIIKLCRFYA